MKENTEKKFLTPKSENVSKWYNEIIIKSGLADRAPVKGCMVIRPYGYAIWEKLQSVLDKMIKDSGAKNAYFPMFIPESFIKKESEHVEGFSPELAVVTIGGGEQLEENLVLRPTSETIMYSMFAKWIDSWRDLPLKINQWCNIIRWTKRPYFFLRTTEFLWQEGHTVHTSHEEAKQEVFRAMDMYKKVFNEYLALTGIVGAKSQFDKFPGAIDTYSYEMLMPGGKALQSCTTHDLGQKFAKAFDVSYLDQDGNTEYGWQTCWGFTTRVIGALVMAHGDDKGLILPPQVAPIQAVIIPIFAKDNKPVLERVDQVKNILKDANILVETDISDESTPGFKFNEWEMKGVPVRVEIGPKDVEKDQVVLVRRDTGEKEFVKTSDVVNRVTDLLNEIQKSLYEKHKEFTKQNTKQLDTFEEFENQMKKDRGFVTAYWCGGKECEDWIKHKTKAATRCYPMEHDDSDIGSCIYCGKKNAQKWLFGQSY
ncbi:proline--tRNA ligase [Candidatus Dojkabacteria bacterium]|nr:proline--tRNA ligase [Candidatus Dojkabacteria bacterium]